MSRDTKQKKERQFREGFVVSDKMDKTITVEVIRIMQHAKFKKIIRSRIRYVVHDEKNKAKQGNKVRIEECRPLSKKKRWKLDKVLV